MKKLFLFIIGVALVANLCFVATAEEQSSEITNVALGKPATSNKPDAANNRKAADLTDGVTSKYTAGDGAWYMHQNYTEAEDNYIEIDLGGNYTINRAKIYSGYFDTEAAGGHKLTDYTIMYQDGGEYKTVPGGVVEGANHGIYEVNFESSVVTDKIKIVENMTTHYRIREIEIYGVLHSESFTNIARDKVATSDMEDAANNRMATDLTDGVTNLYTAGAGSWYVHQNYTETKENYIEIDLDGNYTINRVKIYSGYFDTEAAGGHKLTDYTIMYRDGGIYKTVPGGVVEGANHGIYEVNFESSVVTDKIKIVENMTTHYRIREIEIYGIAAENSDTESDEMPDGTNIAINKGVTASIADGVGDSNSSAANITDGINDTMANKWYVHQNYANQEQYFEINLENNYTINGMVVYSGYDDVENTTDLLCDYTVMYFNEDGYTVIPGGDVSSAVNGKNTVIFTESVTTNKIKVVCHPKDTGYRIRELEIYGTYDSEYIEPDITDNIAFNKKVTASIADHVGDSGSTAAAITDGIKNTMSNKWYAHANYIADGAYFEIDLVDEYVVTGAVMYSGYTDAANTQDLLKEFIVFYLDNDGNYIEAEGGKAENIENGKHNLTFTAPFTSTKVKVACSAQTTGFRVREFELFGNIVNKPPKVVFDIENDGLKLLENTRADIKVEIIGITSDIDNVKLYFDGALTDIVPTIEKTTYTYTLPSNLIVGGSHTVEVLATDTFGAETRQEVTVIVLTPTQIVEKLNKADRSDFESEFYTVVRLLSLDISEFTNLKDETKKLDVLQLLFDEKDFTTTNIEKKLSDAVEKATEPETSTGGFGGGGGGGGGASFVPSKGSVVNAVPTDVEIYSSTQYKDISDKPIFKDLSDVLWAQKAINYLAAKKVINGVGDSCFAPLANVTRGQFVKMLIGAFSSQKPAVNKEKLPFEDVSEDNIFYDYIYEAYQANIINGKTEAHFGCDDFITREEMATVVFRALKYFDIKPADKNDTVIFDDESEFADYSKEAISYLRQKGLISGTGDGKFGAKETTNRAMTAQLLYNILAASASLE